MSDLFFFSSRRRHTRCGRDWSSDMCSSDLSDLVSKQVGCWAARVRELLPGADSVSGRFVSCISTTPGTCNSNGAAIEVQLAWNASGEGCLDSEADELDDSLCIYRIRTQI